MILLTRANQLVEVPHFDESFWRRSIALKNAYRRGVLASSRINQASRLLLCSPAVLTPEERMCWHIGLGEGLKMPGPGSSGQ